MDNEVGSREGGAVVAPPRTSAVWDTTLYRQYWTQKDLAPDAFLFFRLGDFYELFGDDAVRAAPLMEVQLTSRDKKSETPVPMCGVPVHAWTSYAEKLLSRGHKIALCEQLSDPVESKGKIVERGLVRILTPGLPIDFKHLPQKSAHYLMVLSENSESHVDVVLLEFLSGDFRKTQVSSKAALETLLRQTRPAEILVAQSARSSQQFFGVLEALTFPLTRYGEGSAEDLLRAYLRYTQVWSESELQSFWREPQAFELRLQTSSPIYARVSPQVLEQWNVEPDLFEFLDACGSVMGSRKLREMLHQPLYCVERILTRQKICSSINGARDFVRKAREVVDLERLLGRFRVRAAQPRELVRLTLALRTVNDLLKGSTSQKALWDPLFDQESLPSLEENISCLDSLLAKLERVLVLDVDVLRAEGLQSLIRSGCDPEFDRLRETFTTSQDWLSAYEAQLREESGIAKLKVRYNRVFGYFIEVSKAQSVRVPDSFERKQTMINAERYVTKTLRDKEQEILAAEVNIERRAEQLLLSLQETLLMNDLELKQALSSFSWMDALAGASVGIQRSERFDSWCFPQVEQGPFSFSVENGRHPLIEARQGAFVANSMSLGAAGKPRILLLTGPNMAGKSTLMRQTGLCLFLAQCGLKVPAESMRFSPASSFYSRMGASDRILEGESTFMVEMKETAQILSDSDDNSFILIDEIGRGTSTLDGLSIAQAVLESLHERSKALVIFATHYHELSEVAESLDQVQNASMDIKEWNGELIFLRSLSWKPASSSYGIHVAKMAGLPASILDRAQSLFEKSPKDTQKVIDSDRPMAPSSPHTKSPQMSLFEAVTPKESESLRDLQNLDLNELSPKKAWELLERIQRELGKA